MKKTLLSLGFVLISSFAMANTIEVKEEVVVNNESTVEKTIIVLNDSDTCQEFAMIMTDMTDLDPVATNEFYQNMLDLCYYFG